MQVLLIAILSFLKLVVTAGIVVFLIYIAVKLENHSERQTKLLQEIKGLLETITNREEADDDI